MLSRVEIIAAHSGGQILEESIVSDNKNKIFFILYLNYMYLSACEYMFGGQRWNHLASSFMYVIVPQCTCGGKNKIQKPQLLEVSFLTVTRFGRSNSGEQACTGSTFTC